MFEYLIWCLAVVFVVVNVGNALTIWVQFWTKRRG